ncbi:MAG: hypothetical protein KDK96_03145 [Chlamydiia bacterium]|nr:hypothetical protein [Chlamydiia bacterium]
MEPVKSKQPFQSMGPDYQVVSEVDLNFGCNWSVDDLGRLIKGSVEMTFEDEATKGRVSKEIFSDLYKPSLITKEFLESKLSEGKLDSEYEGFLEIFLQQEEYWMDLSLDVHVLLMKMFEQEHIARPEYLISSK